MTKTITLTPSESDDFSFSNGLMTSKPPLRALASPLGS